MPTKLSDIAARIYQGLVTGADQVFILNNLGNDRYFSEALDLECEIEPDLMHLLCKGSVNIRRYYITELNKSILFPYKMIRDKAELLSTDELSKKYPKTWSYLRANRIKLESRERGKWKHDKWYAFGRSQNLSEMEQIKILTPSIANKSSFAFDHEGKYYFVGSGGGGGGGYGITLKPNHEIGYEYILGLLNSRLLDYYLKSLSSAFSGGYYAYNRQYIEQLPIRLIDFSNQIDKTLYSNMVTLVERMLILQEQLKTSQIKSDCQMYEGAIDSINKQIDELVYELYGLTEEEINIVEHVAI